MPVRRSQERRGLLAWRGGGGIGHVLRWRASGELAACVLCDEVEAQEGLTDDGRYDPVPPHDADSACDRGACASGWVDGSHGGVAPAAVALWGRTVGRTAEGARRAGRRAESRGRHRRVCRSTRGYGLAGWMAGERAGGIADLPLPRQEPTRRRTQTFAPRAPAEHASARCGQSPCLRPGRRRVRSSAWWRRAPANSRAQ